MRAVGAKLAHGAHALLPHPRDVGHAVKYSLLGLGTARRARLHSDLREYSVRARTRVTRQRVSFDVGIPFDPQQLVVIPCNAMRSPNTLQSPVPPRTSYNAVLLRGRADEGASSGARGRALGVARKPSGCFFVAEAFSGAAFPNSSRDLRESDNLRDPASEKTPGSFLAPPRPRAAPRPRPADLRRAPSP